MHVMFVYAAGEHRWRHRAGLRRAADHSYQHNYKLGSRLSISLTFRSTHNNIAHSFISKLLYINIFYVYFIFLSFFFFVSSLDININLCLVVGVENFTIFM